MRAGWHLVLLLAAATALLSHPMLVEPARTQEAAPTAGELIARIQELREAGDFEGALEAARQRLRLHERDSETSALSLVEARAQVGSLETIAGLPAAAQDSLSSVEGVTRELLQRFRREPEAALLLGQRQLEVRKAAIPGPHLDTATTLTYLSLIEQNLGRISQAQQHARDALAMMTALYGRRHLNTATGLNNLAGMVRHSGDLLAAEPLYRESLLIRRDLLGDRHDMLAGSYNNLGTLLHDGGEWSEAEEMFRRALAIAEVHYGSEHRNVAMALRHLSTSLRAQGELEESERHLRRALAIHQMLEEGEGRHTAQTLHTLARLLVEAGSYSQADSLFQQSLDMNVRRVGFLHHRVADTLDHMGELSAQRGDLAGAASFHQRALEVRHERQGPGHPASVSTQVLWASSMIRLGRFDDARRDLEHAAEAFEGARLRSGTGFRRATRPLLSPYPLLALTQLSADQPVAAWDALERHQGRLIAELLEISGARGLSSGERAAEDSLRRRLARVGGEVARLERENDPITGSRFEQLHRELLGLEAEWSRFQRDVESRSPGAAARAWTEEQVRSQLSPGSALLGWLEPLEHGTAWAWVVRPDRPITWVKQAPADPKPADSYRAVLHARERPAFGLEVEAAHPGALDLWQQRAASLEAALEGVEELVIVPSGNMLGIPVESLRSEQGWLLDRFAVSYAPSASVFAWLRQRAQHERRPSSALLVGDPPYEKLTPLPWTRREVEALARLFDQSLVLVGPEASEVRLNQLVDQQQLEGYDVVHVASHAQADVQRPQSTAVVLAQSGLPDPVDALLQGKPIVDGRVSVTEILATWKLGASLVTLSACETGLGRRVEGEGYLGLTHALLLAGAQSVLVSLWQVDDEATSRLMTRFYELWLGKMGNSPTSKTQALATAKRELRDHRDAAGRQPFAHPHYWAGFVLLGDSR